MYRTTQHWNQWLAHFLGSKVRECESDYLKDLLKQTYGKHVLLVGVPEQIDFLKSSVISHQVLLSPLIIKDHDSRLVEAEFEDLPILPGSVDVVMVPHTLELIHNPQKLLSEACRIVKPEGHIVILGFNPMSFWGLAKFLSKKKVSPWTGNFLPPNTVKKWLGLAEFELVKQDYIFYRPPVKRHRLFNQLAFLEWLGKGFKPFGGIYVLVAKAKTIPLTPIRLKWKQNLSSLKISIPGPSMRDSVK